MQLSGWPGLLQLRARCCGARPLLRIAHPFFFEGGASQHLRSGRTHMALAVDLDLEVMRRRMVGRRGVTVLYIHERARMRLEVLIDGVALKMRVEAGTLGVADAEVALLADGLHFSPTSRAASRRRLTPGDWPTSAYARAQQARGHVAASGHDAPLALKGTRTGDPFRAVPIGSVRARLGRAPTVGRRPRCRSTSQALGRLRCARRWLNGCAREQADTHP